MGLPIDMGLSIKGGSTILIHSAAESEHMNPAPPHLEYSVFKVDPPFS